MAKKEHFEREHVRKSQKPVAEQFHLSKEDKFPDLVREYWSNPNAQKGKVVICSRASEEYVEEHQSSGI